MMFSNILVVCVGNICRSPTAQCLLQQKLAGRDIKVASAGLGALAGKPMDKKAAAVLEQRGYQGWQEHIARQLTAEHVNDADIILVMEREHINGVLSLAPQARGKVFLLGKWLENREIPDPYRQSEAMFEHVFNLTEKTVDSWIKRLA